MPRGNQSHYAKLQGKTFICVNLDLPDKSPIRKPAHAYGKTGS
jgi:hypothetical protein